MITFRHILNKLHDGEVVDLDVVTYDRKRRTGGQVKNYRCILAQKGTDLNHRPTTPAEARRAKAGYTEKEPKNTRNPLGEHSRDPGGERSRDPNHRQWYTRNVQLVTDDGFPTTIIRKIHIPLIIRFNGQKVVP